MRTIPMRETLGVEFKSDQKTIGKEAILKEVVAMANTNGGEIYIGVEDDGEITGAQKVRRDRIQMQAFVSHNTVPPVYLRAVLMEDDPLRPVMKLEVARSASVVSTLSGTMYRRRYKAGPARSRADVCLRDCHEAF